MKVIAMTVAAVQVYPLQKGEWMAYVTFENIGATQHQKPTLEVWSSCGLDAPPKVGDVLMVMPPRVVGRAGDGDVGDLGGVGSREEAVRELMLALEYLRRACEHAREFTHLEEEILNRAMGVGCRMLAKHKGLLPDFQQSGYWAEVDALPERLGIFENDKTLPTEGAAKKQ